MNAKIAVVTGANKGIGFAISKQLVDNGVHVVITARDESNGKAAVAKLGNKGVEFHQLDITNDESVERLAKYLKDTYKGFDILVNNAGFAVKGDAFDENVASTTIETNYFGTLRVCKKLIPLIRDGGRVVNVSSSAGAPSKLSSSLREKIVSRDITIAELNGWMEKFISDVGKGIWKKEGWPTTTYGVSKIGVTALTRILARENERKNILINACCPGWIKTDMTSNNDAAGKPEDGAKVPVWLALLPPASKFNGGFFRSQDKETQWEDF